MTNRPETGAEHRRAWDAIPWIVNGRASAAERCAVEAHLRACDDCREELERQRRLQAALAGTPGPAPDVQAGLARLWTRLDDAGRESAWAATAAAPALRRRAGAGALVWALVGAVTLEAVGIAILAADRHGDAPFRTLTQPAAIAPRATLRLVPAPSMTMAELQQVLAQQRLQIVAGPNEAGAYALAPLAQPPSTESQLSRLRALPGVRFVEAIPAAEAAR